MARRTRPICRLLCQPRMGHRVLTLSHLYPSPAHPGSGPFVRDEVLELAQRNTMAVVAPILWLPPLPTEASQRVRAVPRVSEEDGIRVIRPRLPSIPFGGRFIEHRMWGIRLTPVLRTVSREIGGESVHAHFALPDGFAAAEFARIENMPVVLTVRGDDVLVFGERLYTRRVLKQTLDRTSAVIAVSEELAECATALGARRDRMWVIPGGVPFPARAARNETRESLGLAADTRCVLWVGSLVPVKQPLHAVAAFERFAAATDDLDAVLVVIGDGALAAEVHKAVDRSPVKSNIRLVGYRPREEVWRWQCAADLLINSSRSEGTPIAVIEALGAGTPVVGYPLPGVRSTVVPLDGGTLAKQATPAALASAMVAEIGVERDRSSLARAAQERYGIARVGRAIERVYESVR